MQSSKPVNVKVRAIESLKIGKHGVGLLTPRQSSIDACIKCHAQGVSHPVGIKVAGDRVRLPSQLPTIEDGILTCVTCHNPHGGYSSYFSRMDFGKDLCVVCHIDNPF